jgi:hypothetical protein
VNGAINLVAFSLIGEHDHDEFDTNDNKSRRKALSAHGGVHRSIVGIVTPVGPQGLAGVFFCRERRPVVILHRPERDKETRVKARRIHCPLPTGLAQRVNASASRCALVFPFGFSLSVLLGTCSLVPLVFSVLLYPLGL